MIRSIALISILALGDPAAIASPATVPKQPSLATNVFTGEEQVPVTIPAGVEISHTNLWKGVDNKTAVIVVRNFSGRDLTSFQLDMGMSSDEEGKSGIYYHGAGQLLNGEKRIIKARDTTPVYSVRLTWSGLEKKSRRYKRGSWYSEDPFSIGKLIVLTFNVNNKITVLQYPPS